MVRYHVYGVATRVDVAGPWHWAVLDTTMVIHSRNVLSPLNLNPVDSQKRTHARQVYKLVVLLSLELPQKEEDITWHCRREVLCSRQKSRRQRV